MGSLLQSSNAFLPSLSSSSSSCHKGKGRIQNATTATLHLPKKKTIVAQLTLQPLSLPSKNKLLVEKLSTMESGISIKRENNNELSSPIFSDSPISSPVIAKLYALAEVVSDRIEMHNNIKEQRNNWNNLLLNSMNAITLTATTMTGLSMAATGGFGQLLGLNLASSLLFTAATGMLLVMNKIQPSQLAEEQRNASRLFKQLHGEIKTKLAIRSFTKTYVNDVVDKVLALDKAFPLPLLGEAMIEKFPKVIEPSTWWPKRTTIQARPSEKIERNGWNDDLEEEMRRVVQVLKKNDSKEYMRLSKLVLKINKILAISGPILTGIAAVGSSFNHGVGAMAGALATVVNTLEHGGQVGMVFEMYRNCGGSFQLLEETIKSTLCEDRWRRENGDLFEMKVALQLGRSLEELRDLATKSSLCKDGDGEFAEFASKLF